jgi:hypothetical protein
MKPEKVFIEAAVLPEHKALFKLKADRRGMTLSAWVGQACLAYERRSGADKEAAETWWASGWRKDTRCLECNQLHDPLKEHPEAFPTGKYNAFEQEQGGVWR